VNSFEVDATVFAGAEGEDPASIAVKRKREGEAIRW